MGVKTRERESFECVTKEKFAKKKRESFFFLLEIPSPPTIERNYFKFICHT